MGDPSEDEVTKAAQAKELAELSGSVTREEFNKAVAKVISTMEDLAGKMGILLSHIGHVTAPTPSVAPAAPNIAREEPPIQKESPSGDYESEATSKDKLPKDSGGGARVPPAASYGPPPNFPMPHINSLGPPPMLDKDRFLNWQYLRESLLNCGVSL